MIENIRIGVYGLLVNNKQELLISDEYIFNKYITKLPGGGLELGESITDCLKREWVEEANAIINVKEHFYTTEFFQKSIFIETQQIISIYYFVELKNINQKLKTSNKKFYFKKLENEAQSFRYIKLNNLKTEEFTLETDKKAISLLLKKYT